MDIDTDWFTVIVNLKDIKHKESHANYKSKWQCRIKKNLFYVQYVYIKKRMYGLIL